jgi:hypothetical protein
LGPGAAPAKVLAELAKRWNAHKAASAGGQAAVIDLTEEYEGVELDFAQLQLGEA